MDDPFFKDFLTPSPKKCGLSLPTSSVNVLRTPPAKPTSPVVRGKSCKPLNLPEELANRLFPHQREGVEWLYKKHCTSRACLLADEMGLGKTIQVCSLLGQLYRTKSIKTTIIVVPVSLIGIWKDALMEWGGMDEKHLEIIHQDTKGRRTTRWRKLSYATCVFITTYGVLRQDATEMSAKLVDYVVLDEAHLIKDPSTNAFNSALLLSAKHKIALTGTPVMNSFDDMWSLFRFLDGAIISLDKSDFQTISKTMLRGNERDASECQKNKAAEELEKLQALIRPFMLRREKKDVSQVGSSKHDSVVWIRLSSVQRALYEAFLKTAEVATALQTDSKSNPLVLLTSLSQICVHPWLNLTEGGFREAMNKPHSVPCEGLGTISSSSKIGVTMALLQQALKDDRKTLVFSRSKRLLHMVAYLLDEASISFCRFDGDLSATDRHQAVTTFNDSPSVKVCLLTTQVGGVGLTFTSASCVILMDPSWNPSADSQAIDRVHRIGQTRDVQVFRLISTGTVEEKVYRNQIFKLMAARQIAGEDGSHLFRYFTKLQLRSMFEVGDLEDSETARQLEELHPDRVTDTVRAYTSSIPQVAAVSDNGCVLTERITGGEEMEEYSQPFSEKRSRTTSVSPGRPPRVREDSSCLDDLREMLGEMEAPTSTPTPTEIEPPGDVADPHETTISTTEAVLPEDDPTPCDIDEAMQKEPADRTASDDEAHSDVHSSASFYSALED